MWIRKKSPEDTYETHALILSPLSDLEITSMAAPPPTGSALDFTDIDWRRQEKEDEQNLLTVLDPLNENDGLFADREVDQADKADDAVDYEDVSDDDLPDEEDATGPSGDNPGLTDDQGTSHDYDDEVDDLFGEGPSSPFRNNEQHEGAQEDEDSAADDEDLIALNFPEHHGFANQDPNIPAPAESSEEFIKQAFPGFETGIILDFNKYLGPKPAHYIPKIPAKPPKPLAPTKVSLDLAPDQEKLFRIAGPAHTSKRKRVAEAEARGYIAIVEESDNEMSGDEGFDYSLPPDDEEIGGTTWADLEIICANWDPLVPQQSEEAVTVEDEPMDDWDREILGYSSKRRKVAHEEDPDFFNIPRFAAPSFDNYAEDVIRIAKRPILDENDPYLLLDNSDYQHAPNRQQASKSVAKRGKFSKKSRCNYSNDEAYDALKENHQHKVRATLGNVTVEHSMPALRLQWPYYRTKLSAKEARSYHRPALKFNKFMNSNIYFSKLLTARKSKTMRHQTAQEVFKMSEHLTLADNYASATLFEYCEEHPTILSNFGMGNRVMNYYRRKHADDAERPQIEDKVGELTVLLPEDQSPFSKFGMVDPGETVRAIHNAMYRAPIYKHETKNTDFLAIRSTTGVGGSNWHLRNIDNLFVVGQQFPLTEIPLPGARKHTNAAKNRLKMIAFRKIKHSKEGALKIGEVTHHIPSSQDLQNRQKLKDFLQYDKVDKVWRMQAGDTVPDESVIRAMISPEELCIIDAMQVGEQHVVDAGFEVGKDDYNDENEAKKTKSIEERLVPWDTTRAFLDASSGKAMLMLHGEGDPTGCGLGISMLKVSMKGGYQGDIKGPNATSGAAMSAAEKKANGGHTYNVKRQEELYNSAIRTIWEKQKANLSDPMEIEATDMELYDDEDEIMEDSMENQMSKPTPGVFDDSASQFSMGGHVQAGEIGRIVRTINNQFGQPEEVVELVTDPRVWKEYYKRRITMEQSNTRLVQTVLRWIQS